MQTNGRKSGKRPKKINEPATTASLYDGDEDAIAPVGEDGNIQTAPGERTVERLKKYAKKGKAKEK